jgi:hypothetical protein
LSLDPTGPTQKVFFVKFSLPVNFAAWEPPPPGGGRKTDSHFGGKIWKGKDKKGENKQENGRKGKEKGRKGNKLRKGEVKG